MVNSRFPAPFALALTALTTAVVVACSGSSDSSAGNVDASCQNFATAECNRIQDCAPLFVQASYGDVATCTTRLKLACTSALQAPSTGATAAQAQSCASALPNVACDDALGRSLPDACQTAAGTLTDGTACADDAQCANKLCRKKTGSTCGACSSPTAAGGKCERDADCSSGLVCAANAVCVAPGGGGATCDANHPCKVSFACKGGTCATAGEAGDSCDPTASGCSLAKGAYCDPTSKVCASVGTAGPGESCNVVNGKVVICSGAGFCKRAGAQATGTCLAPAKDGESCDDTNGPQCLPPAVCENGACKLADPSACK